MLTYFPLIIKKIQWVPYILMNPEIVLQIEYFLVPSIIHLQINWRYLFLLLMLHILNGNAGILITFLTK